MFDEFKSALNRGEVRAAGSRVVEQHGPMRRGEGGRDEPPHVLVAPEPVGEDEGTALRKTADDDVVADDGAHTIGE